MLVLVLDVLKRTSDKIGGLVDVEKVVEVKRVKRVIDVKNFQLRYVDVKSQTRRRMFWSTQRVEQV